MKRATSGKWSPRDPRTPRVRGFVWIIYRALRAARLRPATFLAPFQGALLFACTTHVLPPPPSVDVIQFQAGLNALHEFTPDGYSRAIAHFERAAEVRPENCDYRLNLAQANLFLALEQRMNFEDFHEATERGTDPQCAPGSAFGLRLTAFRSMDDRSALAKIRQAIELEPGNALNWFVHWKLTSSGILKAAELAPNLALIQYELGNYWLVKADYVKAKAAFERALELSPKHFRALIGLAQALSAIDDTAEVEHLYKRAVELAPNFLEGRILLGDYYGGLEENDRARAHYLAALQRNPRFEAAHLRLGLNYLQTAQLDEAERAFRNAIDVNASSYEAYYYAGNVWLARGDFTKAREQYEEALKFVLNFPEATYALGTVFFREGKIDRALEQFEKVLRLNRAHADAYFSRAAIRIRRRQFREAIEDYNRALNLYDSQLVALKKGIEQYEDRGLAKKVEAERKKKDRLEGIMERARQLKMKAEDDSRGL